jgi:tRNA(Ile2) C34 agmatinyltransferase TiaS
MINRNFENIEPPDVQPVCTDCGMRLNAAGECRNCRAINIYEAHDEKSIAMWKGEA